MIHDFGRIFRGTSLMAASAVLLTSLLHAAPPQVRKVLEHPALTPLRVFTGGRTSRTQAPAADGFGSANSVSQWPGAYSRAAFEGTTVFFRVGSGDEMLHVVVDGEAPVVLAKPDPGIYEVDGLGRGSHTIQVSVATESQAGPTVFGGFAVPPGERALTPPHASRQIEFIGDSHTVGYGDLSDKRQCTEDEVWAKTDDTAAFGAITASHYGAEYQVNAISGRGVVRNYDGFKADTLPQAYPYVLLNHEQIANNPGWKPQVLVIALGTNDFSTPLNPGEPWRTRAELRADFEATYARFLRQLRAKNPAASMIVWATDAASGEVEAEARKVVEELQRAGDTNLSFLPVDGLSFGACDSHPSLADEKVIAGKLIQLIDTEPEVWKGQPGGVQPQ